MTYRSESLLFAVAERLVRHYRQRARVVIERELEKAESVQMNINNRKLSDELMTELVIVLKIEGGDMARVGLSEAAHRWEAVSYALFAIEMLETAGVINGRQWGQMFTRPSQAHLRLTLRLGSHVYILGIYESQQDRDDARQKIESAIGELPQKLGRWL